MQENLVTIATYSQPYEAHLAQQRLRQAGIPAFIANEHTISINWLYSNALGGVQVLVPEDRAEDARRVLNENPAPDLPPEFEDPIPCPQCGSFDTEPATVRKVHVWIPLALSALVFFLFGPAFILLVFPLFFGGAGVKCHTCRRTSYVGNWPLRKIGWLVGLPVALVGLVFVLQIGYTAWQQQFTWEERDWNQDGETTLLEYLESAFVVKAPTGQPDCYHYFNKLTREKIKTECTGFPGLRSL